jgi:hypothetical protein
MPRAKLNAAPEPNHPTVSELCDDLQAIAKRIRKRDAKTIEVAIDKLWSLAQLEEDLQALARKLFDLEDEYEADAVKFPEQLPKTDLAVSTFALKEVLEFLSRRATGPARSRFIADQNARGGADQ